MTKSFFDELNSWYIQPNFAILCPLLRLLDGKLSLTSFKWVIPIKNGLTEIRTISDTVRTYNQQIENGLNDVIRTTWYSTLVKVRTLLANPKSFDDSQ